MDAKEISKAVIKRLPRYYRYLGELMEEKVERISSNDLSKKMHVTASQIRQDLNNFGGFGQQGYGYNVEYLYTEIGKILGLDTIHPMIILGAGNLGQALANYGDFEKRGFRLVGIFDINPVLEGISVRGIEIRMINSLPEFIRENQVEIAILTLPKNKAKEMAKVLIDNGIMTSGMEWLDTIQEGVDKGSAMRALEKRFNVKPEEIMAFGDNYNDLEMLAEVKNGVAMENSPEAVKKLCPYRTALVEDTLREILEGKYD